MKLNPDPLYKDGFIIVEHHPDGRCAYWPARDTMALLRIAGQLLQPGQLVPKNTTQNGSPIDRALQHLCLSTGLKHVQAIRYADLTPAHLDNPPSDLKESLLALTWLTTEDQ